MFRSSNRSSRQRILLCGASLLILSVASGCSSIDRLSQIGEQPKLSSIDNPTAQPGYKPVSMPMPKPVIVTDPGVAQTPTPTSVADNDPPVTSRPE